MSTGKTNKAGDGLDLTGHTIGDFHVERRLGQGGMGQVYLAEQVSLKRPVALKILRPELASDPQALERFRAEALAVARATHANIVQVYGFDVLDDGLAYMALEYVEGRNLKEYLARKGPPDLPVCISIMRQVAAALQRAGELGIIHRDIKPENILLTRKTEVKVADFGLSRCLQGEQAALHLTQTGVTMGTPLYMSPEQVEGKPLDPRTDIYSFGVTCYHMLTGQPPFRGETAIEVAMQHLKGKPVPLSRLRPDLPESLCAIVHKMMARHPDDRYQTARDLLRDVVRMREGLPGVNVTGAVPPPLPVDTSAAAPTAGVPTLTSGAGMVTAPLPLPQSRSVMLLVGGLLLAVLVGAGGGVAFAWKERHRDEGLLPAGQDLPVADASVIESLDHLPSKQEKVLHDAVEQYLHPAPGKDDLSGGFGVCADLGRFYLDNSRPDDAGKLFDRLAEDSRPRSYRMLGKLGQAIVLALRDEPKQSNDRFRQMLALTSGKTSKSGKAKKGREGFPKRAEEQFRPLLTIMQNPRWRYWIARARWYNFQNGLDDSEVPPFLRRIPLREGAVEQPGRSIDGAAKPNK
jgi:serine/threonine-protein kinase